MLDPSLTNTSWRTLWPGLELRRRGYEVLIDSHDAGYLPDEVPDGATVVLHLTPSLWAHPTWMPRVEAALACAGRVVVDLDDDWTRIPERSW